METKNEQMLYAGKYRIPSVRLATWDYASNGAYGITICAFQKQHLFGTVIDGKMQYSKLGDAVRECWESVPNHFPHTMLGDFCVMPNHFHAVLFLQTRANDTLQKNTFGPQSKNLASILRGFKIGVTLQARQNGIASPIWQPRFFDRVLRNDGELSRFSEYIRTNPKHWDDDEYRKTRS